MQMEFKRNVGPADRVFRALFSIALLLLALFGSGLMSMTWRVVLGVFAGLNLVESITAY